MYGETSKETTHFHLYCLPFSPPQFYLFAFIHSYLEDPRFNENDEKLCTYYGKLKTYMKVERILQ